MAEVAAQQAELERIRLHNQMQMEREQAQMQRLEYERRLVAEQQEYERRKAFEQQQKQQAIADSEYKNKQRQLLTLSHPDWQELIQTEEYQAWFFQLPSDTQAALANTWDSELTIKAISAFKDWKKLRRKHNNSK
jgi:DNA gyrase/topoisomerase IV subunit A